MSSGLPSEEHTGLFTLRGPDHPGNIYPLFTQHGRAGLFIAWIWLNIGPFLGERHGAATAVVGGLCSNLCGGADSLEKA